MQEDAPELEQTVRKALVSAIQPLLQAYERASERCSSSRMSETDDIGIADLVKGQIRILHLNIQHCE